MLNIELFVLGTASVFNSLLLFFALWGNAKLAKKVTDLLEIQQIGKKGSEGG